MITDIVKQLKEQFELEDIENALIRKFLDINGIDFKKSKYISNLLTNRNDDLMKKFNLLVKLDLNDLVMCFETLVPSEDAKKYGAVFTPVEITSLMARKAISELKAGNQNLNNVTVVDPAVGCGALLVSMLIELFKETNKKPSSILKNFTGVDISDDSIKRCHKLLNLASLFLGDAKECSPTLICTDSLKYNYKKKYDIVIANPPYVRFQDLDIETRKYLKNNWDTCKAGNYNLYFPFFELANNLMSENSVSIYITPNGFQGSSSGRSLRKWAVKEKFFDSILDFGSNRVFNAMTYTCITVSSKKRNEKIFYYQSKGLIELPKLPIDWEIQKSTEFMPPADSVWEFVNKNQLKNYNAIKKHKTKLSSIVNISYGLATLRDNLYILDGSVTSEGYYTKKHNNVIYLIEPGSTSGVIKVSGTTSANIGNTKTRIIFPYEITTGAYKAYGEEELSNLYPKCYQYLLAVKYELDKRDYGKKEYEKWYAYGRTQGLKTLGKSIVTPLYSGKPNFMLTELIQNHFMVNGCKIEVIDKDKYYLEFILKLLNSKVLEFYINSTSNSITGGFFAYQKSQLSDFRIPEISIQEQISACELETNEFNKFIANLYSITNKLF